jgi:decaprenyl-phosphate phosphoribosyltransferase
MLAPVRLQGPVMSTPSANPDSVIHAGTKANGRASWRDYVGIARPDHWIKNIFVLPGVALAVGLSEAVDWPTTLARLAIAMLATCLLASANYTINEWLDAKTDRHHPVKKMRPAALGRMSAPLVLLQWLLLAIVGLSLSWHLGKKFFLVATVLLIMGIIYNVPPLRTKDRPYLDVLSESINNPLRFMLGWTAVISALLPPSSILIAYWMGGAYLMAVKRYSEYRFIGDPQRAGLYRRSFLFYSEHSLLLSAIYYALTSALFLGVFLIKYRIELLLTIPFLALLFVWYLKIGMKHDSAAQKPEKLYKERAFMVYVCGVGALFTILLIVKIPWLAFLVDTHVLPAR